MMTLNKLKQPLEMVALVGGAITFGTAYYLLIIGYPAWVNIEFDSFIELFRRVIMQIGLSQMIISTAAVMASLALFLMTGQMLWIVAVILLLLSVPITMFYMMPINIHFLEAEEPALSSGAGDLLADWGRFQIARFVCDGLAFLAMCKAITTKADRTDCR